MLSPPSSQWAFDEKSATTAAQSMLGTAQDTLGSTVTRTEGLLGQAASLPGGSANSVVDFTGGVGQFGSGDYSLSFWVNPTTTPSGTVELLTNRAADACAASTGSRMSASFVELDHYAAPLCGLAQTASSPSPSVWTHLLFVRQGTAYSIFTNGVRSATTTKTANGQHLLFGRNNDPASLARYAGLVDDVRIYNRAVNDCEASVLGAR